MSKLYSIPSIVCDAFGWDRALAALFAGAKRGETLSEMAGLAQVAGRRWGCVLCRILDVVIARGHCQEAISADGATRGIAQDRAGVALLMSALVLSMVCWALWQAAFFAAHLVMLHV